MLGNRPTAEWIAEYAQSHTNAVNRACHTVGIPTVALSVLVLLASPFVAGLWKAGVALFVVGWTFQFIGPREMVKFQSAQAAMNMLRLLLADDPTPPGP